MASRRSEEGRLLQARIGPPEAVFDQDAVHAILDVSPGGDLVAFGHEAHAHVHRTSDRAEVFRAPDRPPHTRATVSPDGRWLAAGNWNGKDVHVHDMQTGKLAASLPAFGSANGHFSPDGAHVIVSAPAEYVFYSVGDWVPRRRLARGNNNMHGAVEFSRDGRIFAVSHSRRVLRIHDAASAEVLLSLDTPDEEPLNEGLALSADRRWLAAGSRITRRIHLWNLAGIARGLDELGIGHGLSLPDSPRAEGEAPEAPRVEIEVDLGALARPR
jgi:WD40 repeat protein